MQFNLLEEGRAIDGMSLSFNIPLVESTVHGMVWWDQELLLFPSQCDHRQLSLLKWNPRSLSQFIDRRPPMLQHLSFHQKKPISLMGQKGSIQFRERKANKESQSEMILSLRESKIKVGARITLGLGHLPDYLLSQQALTRRRQRHKGRLLQNKRCSCSSFSWKKNGCC